MAEVAGTCKSCFVIVLDNRALIEFYTKEAYTGDIAMNKFPTEFPFIFSPNREVFIKPARRSPHLNRMNKDAGFTMACAKFF